MTGSPLWFHSGHAGDERPPEFNLIVELRSRIRLSLELIPSAWPLKTFIHHNPLHGLENLSFEDAVAQGTSLFGGRGYPGPDVYRAEIRDGRITMADLLDTLEDTGIVECSPNETAFGHRTMTFAQFCAYQFLLPPDGLPHGVETPEGEPQVPLLLDSGPGSASRELLARASRDLGLDSGSSWNDASILSLGKALLERLNRPGANTTSSGRVDPEPDPIIFLHREIARLGPELSFAQWLDLVADLSLEERIDTILADSAELYFDQGQAFWGLPGREKGFFARFRTLWSGRPPALSEEPGMDRWFASLPDTPEMALLYILELWGIPKDEWIPLFSRAFARLPGWAGHIKGMAERGEKGEGYKPVEPVEWLAIRLSLEAFFVDSACRNLWGVRANKPGLLDRLGINPEEFGVRRLRTDPDLPLSLVIDIDDRIARSGRGWSDDRSGWDTLWNRIHASRIRTAQDGSLILLAMIKLWIASGDDAPDPASLSDGQIAVFREWCAQIPRDRFPLWGLLAYEKNYRDRLLEALSRTGGQKKNDGARPDGAQHESEHAPRAQVLFCIDVRSEGVRRHLEAVGPYETGGLAGFFGLPFRFRRFGTDTTESLSPAIVAPRHLLWELHRPYTMASARRFLRSRRWLRWLNHLVHEMKNNIITPYVFVEAIGWVSGLPFFGKTLVPGLYGRLTASVRNLLFPEVSTVIPIDKIPEKDAREIVISEERNTIRRVLSRKWDDKIGDMSPGMLDEFRALVLSGVPKSLPDHSLSALGRFLSLSVREETDLIRELRDVHHITPKHSERRMVDLAKVGMNLSEQAAFAETALTLANRTENFARLVVFLGHKSTSDNNPYESALDCGACGGQSGSPNARAVATLLNRASVREALSRRGIKIPPETVFLAGVHDTTTDTFEFFDREDWPVSHAPEIREFLRDLNQAGAMTARERLETFPKTAPVPSDRVPSAVYARSRDWAEVRPEWGLSGNAAFIIGPREDSRGIDLACRTFLHDYDYRKDPSGKRLETIMNGPLVVAQWINLEHYFSTVDNDVYGSGSKVSHNVTGRFGIVYGNGGDLRIGLPLQTVFDVGKNRHEPMRLTTIVAIPVDRMNALLDQNRNLRDPFDRKWLHLVVRDPERSSFYEYVPGNVWKERVSSGAEARKPVS